MTQPGGCPELNAQMRHVLIQLSVTSTTPAAGYEPTSRSGATDSRVLAGGDTGPATYYARQYGPPFHPATARWPGAGTDARRRDLIEAATVELQQIRGGLVTPRPRFDDESLEARNARMIREGDGWKVRDVAVAFRCGEREVRKVRLEAARNPDDGRELAADAGGDRIARARRMRQAGATTREIAEALSVHQTQVVRWLRPDRPAQQRRRHAA